MGKDALFPSFIPDAAGTTAAVDGPVTVAKPPETLRRNIGQPPLLDRGQEEI